MSTALKIQHKVDNILVVKLGSHEVHVARYALFF